MLRVDEPQTFDFDSLVPEDRVHRLVYTDPAIFSLEMRRIYGGTWVYIGHGSEIPNPGDFRTGYLGLRPVILSRDQRGHVHVLFNRCMHRGAMLTREEKGCTKAFACLYHGWTYDNAGKLTAVGFGDEAYGDDLDRSEWGLRTPPRVEAYPDFYFASLNPDIEPLESHLGLAKRYIDIVIDASPDGSLVVGRPLKYAYAGNWKFLVENWTDAYHPMFTHQDYFHIMEQSFGRRIISGDRGAENVALGNGHSLIDYSVAEMGPRPAGGRVDPEHLAMLSERLGAERAEQVLTLNNFNINIYPNLLFRTDTFGFQIIRPLRVDYTESWFFPYDLKGAPGQVNSKVRSGGGARALDPIQTDDIEAYGRIQEGLTIEAAEWALFNRGLSRERHLPNGEVRGKGGDEVGHRGQHRQWKRLMLQDF